MALSAGFRVEFGTPVAWLSDGNAYVFTTYIDGRWHEDAQHEENPDILQRKVAIRYFTENDRSGEYLHIGPTSPSLDKNGSENRHVVSAGPKGYRPTVKGCC
jgi:hypothetical protein